MPVVHAPDAVVHELHGSVFASYAAPASGSRELCAWRLEVPAGSAGVPHEVSREEILFVLSGALEVTVTGGARPAAPQVGPDPAVRAMPADAARTPADLGTPATASAGDAIVVPAGAVLRIGNAGPGPAVAWVTTSVGLEAVLADGSRIIPPWVR